MLHITAIHMSPPATTHEHIEQVWVVDTETGKGEWWMVRNRAVDHLRNGGKLYIIEKENVDVLARQSPNTSLWYIQTAADGVWQNNLLNLPKH